MLTVKDLLNDLSSEDRTKEILEAAMQLNTLLDSNFYGRSVLESLGRAWREGQSRFILGSLQGMGMPTPPPDLYPQKGGLI
jgi:hypothetical protein